MNECMYKCESVPPVSVYIKKTCSHLKFLLQFFILYYYCAITGLVNQLMLLKYDLGKVWLDRRGTTLTPKFSRFINMAKKQLGNAWDEPDVHVAKYAPCCDDHTER